MILCVCPNPSVDTFAWIDNLQAGHAHRIEREEHYPGGKGAHVAMAAAELGSEVVLVGFWAGPTGHWIRRGCEKLGVVCKGPEVAGWSRLCYTFRSDGPYDETELLGAGPTITEQDVEDFLATVLAELPRAACVTCNGSWPTGSPYDGYARIVAEAHKHHVPALLDCTGEVFRDAIAQRPYAAHLNRNEAGVLLGSFDPAGAGRKLVENCELAVVTAGEKGAWFTHHGRTWRATCPIPTLISPVGSGDCLVAGLAVAVERKYDLQETIRLAVAAGAANCMREELGMLHRAQVEKLLADVQIEETETI